MSALSLKRDESEPSVASPFRSLFVPASQQGENLSHDIKYFILSYDRERLNDIFFQINKQAYFIAYIK
jgi:hypothetical protein